MRILDSISIQNNFAPKPSGSQSNLGILAGPIIAPERSGIPITPSRNNNLRASYSSSVSNKKQQPIKKIQGTNNHQFGQRGGH